MPIKNLERKPTNIDNAGFFNFFVKQDAIVASWYWTKTDFKAVLLDGIWKGE